MWVLVKGFLFLLAVNCCLSALPSKHDVLAALKTARVIGLIGEGLEKLERSLDGTPSPKRCPMAMSHGTRLYGNVTMDRKVNNVLRAMRILQNQNGHTLREVNDLQVLEMFKKVNGELCKAALLPKDCKPDGKYRTADGSCNNLDNPTWGMAFTSQERLLPNAYDDSKGSPRVNGQDGEPLANPRIISNAVHKEDNDAITLSKTLTMQTMVFGQFLDHDMTLTPEISVYEDCCEPEPAEDIDNCFNIIIPEKDKFQTFFKKGGCMELKRSSPVLCPDSTTVEPVRQQQNVITSFIDGSNIYGSSIDEQKKLRTDNGKGYLLKTTVQNGKERILDGEDCLQDNPKKICFSRAGDIRVNEVPSLTSMHFLFVKEHNRIANKLKNFYSGPNRDELVFQETKLLVGALLQKFTYDEYLTSFLSETTLNKYKLPTSNEYKYDKTVNPSILNSFAAAAYRMGHTWIPPQMIFLNKNFKSVGNGEVDIEDTFFNPSMTYNAQSFERLMYWMSGEPTPETDSLMVDGVRNNLFINTTTSFALDLAALNIQRGRDHGLPSYNEYRVFCKLEPLDASWDKFPKNEFVAGIKKKLITAGYGSPLDIDLFTGGLVENPVVGGNLGQTFECLLGEQFSRVKVGDRYWFQNSEFGYNEKQVKEIQNYSFAKLLCNNIKYNEIQYPNAFKFTDPFKKCNKIEDSDLDFSSFDPRGQAPQKKETLDREREMLKDLLEELELE